MRSVLTIAASDPCGGAGIQADVRVIFDQGLVGLSCLTAVTVQNTRSVQSVSPLSPELIEAQLSHLLADIRPDATKIGLLPGREAVNAVTAVLKDHRLPHIVVDPVLASSGGVPFLDDAGREALLGSLAPLCELITPNLTELANLTGCAVSSPESERSAAHVLMRAGAGAVLVKGGHRIGDPEDILYLPGGVEHRFPGVRISTLHTHGTGCFLSSAIASRLALGDPLPRAIRTSKQLLELGLNSPSDIGGGRGSPLPRARRESADAPTHAQRLSRLPGIYVITDPVLQRGRSARMVAEAAWDGGASVVQLREKNISTDSLVSAATEIARIARERGRLFIVNDRVDIALASEADGVHLGPGDMDPFRARDLMGADRLIGVSTGTVEEALRCLPVASYFGVGAIYATSTKADAGPPVGPERIRAIREACPDTPIVAIGGVAAGRISEVIQAGAEGVAVVSAVLAHDDIAAATSALVKEFERSSASEAPRIQVSKERSPHAVDDELPQ